MKIIWFKVKHPKKRLPLLIFPAIVLPLLIAAAPVQPNPPEEIPPADTVIETKPAVVTISKPVKPPKKSVSNSKPIPQTEPSVICDTIPLSPKLQQFTYDLCEQNDVPYPLVLAIIEHESNFNSKAVHQNTNGTTDSGLMQINDIAKEHIKKSFGVTNLMDPKQNIKAGIGILSDYLKDYNLNDAVMAYALGETGMSNARKSGRTSTKATSEILSLMAEYETLFPFLSENQ